MKILVTGGAGYIGSFMTKRLIESGHDVVVVDSLERGYKEAVDQKAKLEIGKIQDETFINRIFSENKFDTVIHFAGYISVSESMEKPELYFENNSFATLSLLNVMVKNGVKSIIFSSTAAVYGDPLEIPINEDHPNNPTSVYGESKLMTEKIINWFSKVYDLKYASLRYFNACGADPDGNLGEAHNPESHIIPNALDSILKNKEFILYGTDWETKDGTCVRDYIHVIDLVEAHILVLNKITSESRNYIYNVGTGSGYSNKEIMEAVEKVTGFKLSVKASKRREGDPKALVADPKKIQSELGFISKHSDLETIISSAWKWHKNNSK